MRRQAATVVENYLSLWFPHAGTNYPELCVGWTTCLEVLKSVIEYRAVGNDKRPVQPAYFFVYHVQSYFNGNWPPGYLDAVKRPSSLYQVCLDVFSCKVRSILQFEESLSRVFLNCEKYYAKRPDGASYLAYARTLRGILPNFIKYNVKLHASKMLGGRTRWKRVADVGSYKLRSVAMKYLVESLGTDTFQLAGTMCRTMDVFSVPMNDDTHPGFRDVVPHPVTVTTIVNKANRRGYRTYEDFESDILTLFDDRAAYTASQGFTDDSKMIMKYCESGRKAFKKYGNVMGKKVRT